MHAYVIYFSNFIVGAAIAPPPMLTETSKPLSDDKPEYQPTFGSGSKG